MEDGLQIDIIKEDTKEVIVSLVVVSKTDIPAVVGDIIEKDGYKAVVYQN
jgi:hypothetical protein